MYLEAIKSIKEYTKFISELYTGDEFFKDNKTGLLPIVCGSNSVFTKNSIQKMVVVKHEGIILCQGIFIIHNNAKDMLSVAFFEARGNQKKAVDMLINAAIDFAKANNAVKIVFGLDGHCNNSVGYSLSQKKDFGNSKLLNDCKTNHVELIIDNTIKVVPDKITKFSTSGNCDYSHVVKSAPSFGECYNKPYYKDYFKTFNEVKFVSFYDDIANVNEKVNKDLSILLKQVTRSNNNNTTNISTNDNNINNDFINNSKSEKNISIENDNIDIGILESVFKKEKNIILEKADFGQQKFFKTMKRYTDLNNQIFKNHRYYFKREYEEDIELFASMRPLLKNENLIFAKKDKADIGFILWYPDFNDYVPKGKGAGVMTLLKYKVFGESPQTGKVVEIGLIESEKNKGLILMLFAKAISYANRFKGIKKVSSSWILDENTASKNITKRYTKLSGKEYATFEYQLSDGHYLSNEYNITEKCQHSDAQHISNEQNEYHFARAHNSEASCVSKESFHINEERHAAKEDCIYDESQINIDGYINKDCNILNENADVKESQQSDRDSRINPKYTIKSKTLDKNKFHGFKGQIHENIPPDWDMKTSDAPWLSSQNLIVARKSSNKFSTVTHPLYCCCEYKQTLNIFTFGKFNLSIPFTVIAPPISIGECGFTGELNELISDYKKRKGLFLMLNLSKESFSYAHTTNTTNITGIKDAINNNLNNLNTNKNDDPNISIKISGATIGRTLFTSIFENKFKTFDDYLNEVRSPYRRRINQALKRGEKLEWRKIQCVEFDEKMHRLYLEVLGKSKYPLETLGIEFFQEFDGEIYVLYEKADLPGNMKPLAFVLTKLNPDISENKNTGSEIVFKNTLNFIFGGMEYEKRDEYDLYYNMLLKIIRIGIDKNVREIDFGQTAESSKGRIGCHLEDKYMVFFSGNKIINLLVKIFSRFLDYTPPKEMYHIWKN